jgi:hypothetical protein
MAVEELLQYGHPDAIYRRVPLPDEQNALGPWREAAECYSEPDEKDDLWWKQVYGNEEDNEPVPFPDGSDGEHIRSTLAGNRRAFELLESGIARGCVQLPEGRGHELLNSEVEILSAKC